MTQYHSAKIEQKLTHHIHVFLHEEYRDISSPIKRIAQKTGLATETIKRWYNGRNPPKTAHLIILAKSYPQVMQLLLEETGYSDLIPFMIPLIKENKLKEELPQTSSCTTKNVPINVPIKIEGHRFNLRQRWFLVQLQKGSTICATDISSHWSVSIKTARRDISAL